MLLNHVEYLQGNISISQPHFSRKFPNQRGSSQQQHPRRVESAALATDPALWPAPHHRPRATRTQGLDSAHPSCGLCCLGVLVLAFKKGG